MWIGTAVMINENLKCLEWKLLCHKARKSCRENNIIWGHKLIITVVTQFSKLCDVMNDKFVVKLCGKSCVVILHLSYNYLSVRKNVIVISFIGK